MGALRLSAVIIFFITGCGANLEQNLSPPKVTPALGAGIFLEGKMRNATGEAMVLSDLKSKPLVLNFASEFCETCLSEVEQFKRKIKNPERTLSKISIVTVLLGADALNAREWQDLHGVFWEVAVEESSVLFKKWCPESITPCVLIQVPDKGVVLRKTGVVAIEEIEKWTGNWD